MKHRSGRLSSSVDSPRSAVSARGSRPQKRAHSMRSYGELPPPAGPTTRDLTDALTMDRFDAAARAAATPWPIGVRCHTPQPTPPFVDDDDDDEDDDKDRGSGGGNIDPDDDDEGWSDDDDEDDDDGWSAGAG